MFASTSLISRLFAHKSLTSIVGHSIQKKHFSMHSYTATKPGGGQVVRPLSPHLTVYVFKENSELDKSRSHLAPCTSLTPSINSSRY